VATTTISLIKEQTQKVGVPRGLWVPFPLGRPLGSATDPEFQKDVMRGAFDLLQTATEPTIVDYPVDAPDAPNRVLPRSARVWYAQVFSRATSATNRPASDSSGCSGARLSGQAQ